MITPSDIYWLTRLDGINDLFSALAILAFVISIIGLIAGCIYVSMSWTEDERDGGKAVLSMSFKTAIVATVLATLAVLTPTTKEAAAIIVIPKVANSESVQQLGDGIIDLANQWLKELAPKKEAE